MVKKAARKTGELGSPRQFSEKTGDGAAAVKAKVQGTRVREVTLGGETYEIRALNMKKAREWREQFGEPLQTIIGILQNAEDIELDSIADVASLLNQAGHLLLNSVDILVEALFAYSPALQADRERIEEAADDVEALEALWEVIQLAYPFGPLVTRIGDGVGTTGSSKN